MWTKDDILRYLQEDRFVLFYQLQYNLAQNTVTGAEVLLRFKGDDGQLMSPFVFMPMLEAADATVDLDMWVFRQACQLHKKWITQGMPIIPLSTNFSIMTMSNPVRIYDLMLIVREYNLQASAIHIELTGTASCVNPKGFEKSMQYLNANGFKIYLDDFGAGFSTLSVFSDVPFGGIKIDREILQKCLHNPRKQIILRTIIDLGLRLEIDVVCEGVETKEEMDLLHQFGCTHGQGYYFSKPMLGEELEALLQSQALALC